MASFLQNMSGLSLSPPPRFSGPGVSPLKQSASLTDMIAVFDDASKAGAAQFPPHASSKINWGSPPAGSSFFGEGELVQEADFMQEDLVAGSPYSDSSSYLPEPPCPPGTHDHHGHQHSHQHAHSASSSNFSTSAETSPAQRFAPQPEASFGELELPAAHFTAAQAAGARYAAPKLVTAAKQHAHSHDHGSACASEDEDESEEESGSTGRRRTRVACFGCHKAKSACGAQRPCLRCVRLGRADKCEDRPRRKRRRRTQLVSASGKTDLTPLLQGGLPPSPGTVAAQGPATHRSKRLKSDQSVSSSVFSDSEESLASVETAAAKAPQVNALDANTFALWDKLASLTKERACIGAPWKPRPFEVPVPVLRLQRAEPTSQRGASRDVRKNLVSVNPEFTRLLGWSDDEMARFIVAEHSVRPPGVPAGSVVWPSRVAGLQVDPTRERDQTVTSVVRLYSKLGGDMKAFMCNARFTADSATVVFTPLDVLAI